MRQQLRGMLWFGEGGGFPLLWQTTAAFLQLQEVTCKRPAGQAGQDVGRRIVWALRCMLCVVPKGGFRGRKAHAQHERPAGSVSAVVRARSSEGDVQQC